MELWGGSGSARRAASVPGLDIHVHADVFEDDADGGDVYYVSMCGAGNITRCVLADVSGHGAAVAEASAVLRKQMRRNINTLDQTRMARQLNEEFNADQEGARFATALLLTYFAPARRLVIVNAGHPPPLLWRAKQRAWSFAVPEDADASPAALNLPLGIIEPMGYEQFAVPIGPGDFAVLYTDALPETPDADGTQLGQSGLLALAGTIDAPAGGTVAGELATRLERRRGGAPADDDQTIVVLSHNGGTPPRQSMGDKLAVLGRMMGIGRLDPA